MLRVAQGASVTKALEKAMADEGLVSLVRILAGILAGVLEGYSRGYWRGSSLWYRFAIRITTMQQQ